MGLADIAIWWLALEITGFAALPVSSYICRNLKDHGYSVSKPLGLLLLTYISWMISFSAGYSTYSVALALGIIAVVSLIVYRRKGLLIDKNYAIKFEVLFLLAFLGFAVIRAYSPDIYWTGGEKIMDMTYINSLLRTSQFPPADPWMSGTSIYYYYFGYLIVADLIKITAVLPSIAFNLATASFFALSLTAAFGIGYNLTERIKYGVITAFFVTLAGNLVGFFQLMYVLFIQKGGMNGALSFYYWTSSRVIPDTINEFPYFSFLQGDVHAHMISIAFQLLIILLLLNVMKSGTPGIASILILGLSIGFLYPLNTWDYPVYLFLAVFVLVSHFIITNRLSLKPVKDFVKLIAAIGATAAFSYLLYLPYHASYKVDKTISFVPSGRTSLIFYLAIYGAFIYLLYSFVMLNYKKSNLKPGYYNISLILLSITASVVILISAIELKSFISDNVSNPQINELELMILLVPLLILSAISIIREKDKNRVFVLILIITGIFISLFCEFFYIKDALGSGNPVYIRLNTVFKLYLQNWVMWGASAGAIVFYFRESFTGRKAWSIIAIILILMISIYPVLATIGKSVGFGGAPTLDGEAYVSREHPQDYEAILWFRNISGQPVVLQAPGDLYQWNTYITAFTGLPTVIGWAGHEKNWRYPYSYEVDTRWSDAGTIYTSLNLNDVDALLRKYNVSYIYFGDAEAKKYSSPKLFEAHPERFEKVFEYRDVVVYKVMVRNPEK
ncbi:Uncharacterised protein [uncultured archaeon]|nr:Uncharacterised protein [uncultured archaeon]